MKKTIVKIIIISCIILIFVFITKAFNGGEDSPDEILELINNTNEHKYFGVNISSSALYLIQKKNDYQYSISIGLQNNIPDNYVKFENVVYKVSINDSRYNDQVKSWMKLDGENLLGPKMRDTTPYTAYNIKDYFDSTKNETAVALDKIHSYEKQKESFFDGWITYKAKYDLEGAEGGLPIPSEAYQGEVIISINEDNTKMREIYISNNKWVYIRHLEKGEYPREINDDDLDDILENMWWTWEEILQPVVGKAKSKIE